MTKLYTLICRLPSFHEHIQRLKKKKQEKKTTLLHFVVNGNSSVPRRFSSTENIGDLGGKCLGNRGHA